GTGRVLVGADVEALQGERPVVPGDVVLIAVDVLQRPVRPCGLEGDRGGGLGEDLGVRQSGGDDPPVGIATGEGGVAAVLGADLEDLADGGGAVRFGAGGGVERRVALPPPCQLPRR